MQRVDTGQAVHLINDDGFELEIQLEPSLAAKRMGSGVLFTDELGRALLVEPTYKDYWEIVGGAVEQDESPYQAAIRLPQEELRSWAWCTTAEAAGRMPGKLARRVEMALRAQADGQMFYLENGFATLTG